MMRMNAIVLDLAPALPREPFVAATAQVNEWRGRCLEAFTRGETAVTECLAILGQVKGRGDKVKLPHLVGQRLEALSAAISADGPFAAEAGKAAAATLDLYRRQAGLRNLLCHGTSKVTLDSKGRWTVVLRLVMLRSREISRESLAVTQEEAAILCSEITEISHKVSAQLGQIRANLR
jgi:hypothetical protein